MPYLWAEKYQPLGEAQLVVSKKKVLEVKDFLVSGAARGRRLLILRGPTGCGKASVLQALSRDLNLEVVEWSAASRWGSKTQAQDLRAESLSDSFLSFLAQTDRYCSLDSQGSKASFKPRVAFVRDFPSTLMEGPGGQGVRGGAFLQRFKDAVCSGSLQRVVLSFNDSEYRSFSRLLAQIDSESVAVIAFEAIPRTFAQKALEGAVQAEGVAGAVDTAALSVECGGDLRHAFNVLQMRAGPLLGQAPVRPLQPTGSKKGRGRKLAPQLSQVSNESCDGGNTCSASLGLRPASMGFFHALGRLLWCKRPPPDTGEVQAPASGRPTKRSRCSTAGGQEPRQLPPEYLLPKANRPPLYFVPEDVVAGSGSDPSQIVDWVFTNAPRFFGDVCDLADFTATLAEVDGWQSSHDSQFEGTSHAVDELAITVQVRSMLDANVHPVPPTFGDQFANGAQPEHAASLVFNMVRPLMRDAALLRQQRKEELAAQLGSTGLWPFDGGLPSRVLIMDTLPFAHQILQQTSGHHPSLRRLPHRLMKLTQELSLGIDSGLLRSTADDEQQPKARAFALQRVKHDAAGPPSVPWAHLDDDPIEDWKD